MADLDEIAAAMDRLFTDYEQRAYERGLAVGRAEVLRDVAKAETPYVLVIASDETEGARCVFCHCVHRLGLADIKHHDGCIWVQAQAAQESSHA